MTGEAGCHRPLKQACRADAAGIERIPNGRPRVESDSGTLARCATAIQPGAIVPGHWNHVAPATAVSKLG
jgi:hypothetical protein